MMTSTLQGLPEGAATTLHECWPHLPWHRAHEAHGAFHSVLILPGAAVIRVRTGADHRSLTHREASTASMLAAAGLRVPGALGDGVGTAQWTAHRYEVVDGAAFTPRSWQKDRGLILSLLEQWRGTAAAHPELRASLPPPRHWCGGEEWPRIAHRLTADSPDIASLARTRIESLLKMEAGAEHTLVHGDFGPHNILLAAEDGVPWLIDTDNAAWADPALDIAPLLASYAAEDLAADFPDTMMQRAIAHRRTLSLQVAAAAAARGDTELVTHALGNFRRRVLTEPGW